MKILIIEDEPTASAKLVEMLQRLDSSYSICEVLESVSDAIDWFQNHAHPQLAFVDIQLADDVSFEIFKKIDVRFPVIFTTAYDQYILEALEINSIDYLLKPIREERLKKALDKVKTLEYHFLQSKLGALLQQAPAKKKRRYLVKKGIDFVSITLDDIAYFFTEHKVVFLTDNDGKKYIVDKTISELADELKDELFFRVNRKYLVKIDAIQKFKSDQGKILLHIYPPVAEEVVVSKENAPNFRSWIESV